MITSSSLTCKEHTMTKTKKPLDKMTDKELNNFYTNTQVKILTAIRSNDALDVAFWTRLKDNASYEMNMRGI
jgi:hypothetical protein